MAREEEGELEYLELEAIEREATRERDDDVATVAAKLQISIEIAAIICCLVDEVRELRIALEESQRNDSAPRGSVQVHTASSALLAEHGWPEFGHEWESQSWTEFDDDRY